MDLLLAHWHCILPALIIVVAMFFMKDKNKDNSCEQLKEKVRLSDRDNKEE